MHASRSASALFAAAALVAWAASARAQASVDVSAAAVSRYVWRGADVLGGPALQPSLTVSLRGFSASAWVSLAADRQARVGAGSAGDLDELDVTLAYDRRAGAVALSAGVVGYNWYRQAAWPATTASTLEAYAGAALPGAPGAPAVRVYYDPNRHGGDGVYATASAGYTASAGSVPLTVGGSVGYMDQRWAPTGFSDLNLSVGTELPAGGLALRPTVTATHRPHAPDGERPTLVWVGLQASWRR